MMSVHSAITRRRRVAGSAALTPALILATGLILAALLPAGLAWAQGSAAGALFPEPFVVEHHLVQTDSDGSRFESQPVTDYYGGSWIVSVRPDGSRRVVDLARREVTEVMPGRGTYWSVSFDRLGELSARLADLATARTREARGDNRSAEPRRARAGARFGTDDEPAPGGPPELVVRELSVATPSVRSGSRAASGGVGGSEAEPEPASRPGVTHLRVVEESRSEEAGAGLEVWLDPAVRLRPAALDALSAFESAVLAPAARAGREAAESGSDTGAGSGGASAAKATADSRAPRPATAGEKLAAARAHAAGAVPVRTLRSLADPRSGKPAGTLEDRVTRLERIDALPLELVEIPEGLRRVPHPAEALVPFLEDELELDRAMSGRPDSAAVTGGGER